MDVFEKVAQATRDLGKDVIHSAKNFGSAIASPTKEQKELAELNVQKSVAEEKLNALYAEIGKRYVEFVNEENKTEEFDVSEIIEEINPELEILSDVSASIAELEISIKKANDEKQRKKAQEKFDAEKAKLDKAIELDVIDKAEYEEKLAAAQNRLDNFDKLRKVEAQYNMGIITKDEYNEKISAILNLDK